MKIFNNFYTVEEKTILYPNLGGNVVFSILKSSPFSNQKEKSLVTFRFAKEPVIHAIYSKDSSLVDDFQMAVANRGDCDDNDELVHKFIDSKRKSFFRNLTTAKGFDITINLN